LLALCFFVILIVYHAMHCKAIITITINVFLFASPSSAQSDAGGSWLLLFIQFASFFDFPTALLDYDDLVPCARLLCSLFSKGNIHQLLIDAQPMHLALQHEQYCASSYIDSAFTWSIIKQLICCGSLIIDVGSDGKQGIN